jgi:DNA-binding transcriptional MerR regulator
MSDATFTHKDLSRMLGVSETTVKSYRRKFPGCIPVANQGKPIRFTAEAAQVAVRIRALFDTGMSVEEVRARLAAEFPFISPEPEEAPSGKRNAGTSERAEVTPELSLGVSNMAKGMVALTQQQKSILSRVRGIEGRLENLGLKETASNAPDEQQIEQRIEAGRRREEQIEQRLDRLDETARDLAKTVNDLAGKLGRLIGQRARAAEEWRSAGAETLSSAARIAAETMAMRAETSPSPVREVAGARVIPLRPDAGTDNTAENPASGSASRSPGFVPARSDAHNAASAAEPPRQFFGLPLVVRTEQGQYVSAGGKSRGRFSLNDLKAMLIYGYTPPHHFTLRWESHGQGWWLCLEQETSDRTVHLLLMELPTQRSGNVVEILQIKNNGATLHPAEICAIIDSFASRG